MSDQENTAKFELHLPGLLKVLAEHLYSDPRVGFRELLQNSHDSCSRRAIESDDATYQPEIRVRADADGRTLLIEDNGSGLTESEIVSYLSTIGRGYTRELRSATQFDDDGAGNQLIGQFGLGFLSAFLVASEVEVHTLSFQDGARPMIWRSEGDESYKLVPGDRTTVGTTIRLRCKPQMRFLLCPEKMQELIARFCDFLPYPIYVQDDAYPSNRQVAPWDQADADAALRDYLKSKHQRQDILWSMPLQDATYRLGSETITVPLSGVLYIPWQSVASICEFGELSVYIRGMFITDNNRTVLPEWAKFVSGMVSTPFLQPTASREDLHADESLEIVQEVVEQQLMDGLTRLSQTDPSTWEDVIESHHDLILGWASRSEAFFDCIADRIKLDSSRGMVTMQEYLRGTGNDRVYFFTKKNATLCEQVLLEGRDMPVIDGTWFGVTQFLERYSNKVRPLELIPVDSDTSSLVRSINQTPFESLIEQFRRVGVDARVVEYAPRELPAFVYYSPNAEFLRESEKALGAGELMPGIADMIGQYADSLRGQGTDEDNTLLINASSPLIRQLQQQSDRGKCDTTTLRLIAHFARVFTGRVLDVETCVTEFAGITEALLDGLSGEAAAERQGDQV